MTYKVHPHGRGDGAMRLARSMLVDGSPPRAWGRRDAIDHVLLIVYGSPPRAWGRRMREAHTPARTSVHPHGRGDGALVYGAGALVVRFTPTGVGTAS